MSVGAGGDALVRYRLLQRRHLLLSGGQSVSGPSRWLMMNGLGSIWLRAACWENVGGGGGEEQFSHLFTPIYRSIVQLAYSSSYQLLPLRSSLQHQTLSAGFFSFLIISVIHHLRLHHSAASPSSLLHLSFSLSASCFSLSTATSSLMFPPRFIFPPSWQRTVREAGTSTCTRRLSGDAAAVLSSAN